MLLAGLPSRNNIRSYQYILLGTLGPKLAAMGGVVDTAVGHTGRLVHL